MTNDNIRLTYRRDPLIPLRCARCLIVGTIELTSAASRSTRAGIGGFCRCPAPQANRPPRGFTWTSCVTSCGPKPATGPGSCIETAYLPDTLKGAQSELTEQDRAVDEVAEEVIGEWLAANTQVVTRNQIAGGINWTPDCRSIDRITTVLNQLTYTRGAVERSVGGRKWVWTPPDGPTQLEL